MARLTNFNTTTFSIAMSKNTGHNTLVQELASLPEALESIGLSKSGEAVILARMIQGISSDAWQQLCQAYPLGKWVALPVAANGDMEAESLQGSEDQLLPITPFREVHGALTRSMFANLLKRELVRLSRNNGSISLVAASLADRRGIAAALGDAALHRLDMLLGSTMLEQLQACDALGITRKGVFICSLPGMGQLATRHFAEKCQNDFENAARPYFPAGGVNAGEKGKCAIGIVNVMQGESCTVGDLLRRANTALDAALLKSGSYIHQESPLAPFEGTTLVHSSEKRFLFFGGDPS